MHKLITVFAIYCVLIANTLNANAETLLDRIRTANYLPANSIQDIQLTKQRRSEIETIIRALIDKSYVQTDSKSLVNGFIVERYIEDGQKFWLVGPSKPAAEPYVVIAEKAERNIVFSAPHPIKDRATGIQAIVLLQALRGRAAIISGNHRCAATQKTLCSGKTRICGGGRQRYPVSDPAHHLENLFHETHVLLANIWPKSIFIQLHGFAGRGTETLFVLSDGSRKRKSKDSGIAGRVRDELRKALGSQAVATSCQDTDDDVFGYRKLCARTNVQGRYLNGSKNICRKSAKMPSGRFLHIEQQWVVRKAAQYSGLNASSKIYLETLIHAIKQTH
ncbi:MAG: hypothetical protein CMM52_12945 [Rhodospirillaceae bacterium]|nr:hypothetical protein [Rhodospirillaceae bacterium]|tara:strand:- start:19675 stop:20676 length:1002 start_codon:yes stop_codon:yes gene_type:complete